MDADPHFGDERGEISRRAYEGTVRELASQEAALAELRTRAGLIIGLAASFGAVAVGLTSANQDLADFSWLQILLLIAGSAGTAGTLGLGFWLLGSVKLTLHSSAKRIIEDNWKGPVSRVYNDLAHHQEDSICKNQVKLDKRHLMLHLMAASALVQLFSWSALIGLLR